MKKTLTMKKFKPVFLVIPTLFLVSLGIVWKFGFDFATDLRNTTVVAVNQSASNYTEINDKVYEVFEVDKLEVVEQNQDKISRYYITNFDGSLVADYELDIVKVFVNFPMSVVDIVATVIFALFIQGIVLYMSFKKVISSSQLFVFILNNSFFLLAWGALVLAILSLINLAGMSLSNFSLTALVTTFFAGCIMLTWLLLSALEGREDVQIKNIGDFVGEYFKQTSSKVTWQLVFVTIFCLPLVGLMSFRFEVVLFVLSIWLLYLLLAKFYPYHQNFEQWEKKSKSKQN